MKYVDHLPSFTTNTHYKELSPLEGGYKYRFITLQDTTLYFKNYIIPYEQIIYLIDSKDRVWCEIGHDYMTISKDYAWDGCTPKKWWKIWWGSPDFKDTILASLVHDVGCQFISTEHFPFDRKQNNLIFKEILICNKFIFQSIYYIGVEIGRYLPYKTHIVKSLLTSIVRD